ncbi:hypothetical protein SK128_018654, partial [Halocaridina rubra]
EDNLVPIGIGVHEHEPEGPPYNPKDIDPQEMMAEVMDRHDKYFNKHFAPTRIEQQRTEAQGKWENLIQRYRNKLSLNPNELE